MTHLRYLIVSTLTLCSLALPAVNSATYTAPATRATVFLSGAQLTHTATLPLKKGENVLQIEGLSPDISRPSLQIQLSGGAVISAYEYAIHYTASAGDDHRTQVLTDSLTLLQNRLQSLNNLLSTNQQMHELLQAGVSHSVQVDRVNVTTETIEKNISYFQTRSLQLQTEQTRLNADITATQEQIRQLKAQLQQDKSKNNMRTGLLTLTIQSVRNQNILAQIRYFTPSASWQPSYTLQVTDLHSPIQATLKAAVRQTTGLDWQNILLTLSTAAPSTNQQAPQLTTTYVRPYEQPVYRKSYATAKLAMVPAEAMNAATADFAVAEEADEEVQDYALNDYLTTQNNQLSVEYQIDIPYTIPGNNKEQTIALLNKNIENVSYSYLTIPQKDETAYLMASINNWSEQQLLDGTATINYNGTFYGTTRLTSSSQEKVQLTLGDDPQILVKREMLTDFTATQSIGKDKQETKAYRITLRNNKNEPVSLTLKEAYPVSTDKQIRVVILEQTTPPDGHDKERGFLTYQIELQPNESRQLTVAYSIRHPKTTPIIVQ